MAPAMHNADSTYTKPVPYSQGHAFSWQTICKYYPVDGETRSSRWPQLVNNDGKCTSHVCPTPETRGT